MVSATWLADKAIRERNKAKTWVKTAVKDLADAKSETKQAALALECQSCATQGAFVILLSSSNINAMLWAQIDKSTEKNQKLCLQIYHCDDGHVDEQVRATTGCGGCAIDWVFNRCDEDSQRSNRKYGRETDGKHGSWTVANQGCQSKVDNLEVEIRAQDEIFRLKSGKSRLSTRSQKYRIQK